MQFIKNLTIFMTSQKLPQILQSEKYHSTEGANSKYLMGFVGGLEGDRQHGISYQPQEDK
jgi:hypothetical protein